MKNITYIISQVNKSVSFELTATLLNKQKFNVLFILMHDRNSPLEEFLRANDIQVIRVFYRTKKDLPFSVIKIIRALRAHKTDIVHAHLFEASLAGLIAAKLAGTRRRIHTRHNSTIHHQYHRQAVKYDRLINFLSTEIIAVSDAVKRVLMDMENVQPSKIRVIHHGFEIADYTGIPQERITALRNKYLGGKTPSPLIGVISRYIHWKGIQHIIPAFRDVLKLYPSAHLLLANANGPYQQELRRLLSELPPNSYTEIPFEEDVQALYQLFDTFVHVPIDDKSEAFGQVYVEALAAGIPSVFTLSGIAPDFIVHEKNALLVPHESSEAIFSAIRMLQTDEGLRNKLIREGKKSVAEQFEVHRMIKQLEELYEA